LTNGSPEDIAGILAQIESGRYRRILELTTNAAAMLHRAEYRRIRDLLDRQIQIVWQNRLTMHAMGRLWIRNTIMNLPSLVDTRIPLFDDRPVVVAGAGPSLDDSLLLLSDLREEIQIVAVDTAVPALADAGITPDIVIAVEAQLANAYDFLPVADRSYTLIADIGSSPAAADLHKSRAWIISVHSPISLLERVSALPGIISTLPPLGSVGVSAVLIALQYTKAPLFLTGLDFSVLRGQTHARGTTAPRWQHIHSDRLSPVEDPTIGVPRITAPAAAGGRCVTTLVLAGYAKELVKTIGGRDAYEISAIGPYIGAKPIDPGHARTLIRQFSGTLARGAERERVVNATAAEITQFIAQEIEFLSRFLSGDRSTKTVSACDYLNAVSGIGSTDADSNAAAIMATYFLHRWQVSLNLLSLPRS
jgi:hypothetical protein